MPISVKRPVVRKKLSDTVEEELELMIRQGEFTEGDALPSERELMAVFGVGRPSIRDALSALARKGLVKISSGERTRVTQPSADHIISELSGMSKDFLSQPGGVGGAAKHDKFPGGRRPYPGVRHTIGVVLGFES